MPSNGISSETSRKRISRRKWLKVAGAGSIAAISGCGGDGDADGDGTTDDSDGDAGTTVGDSTSVTTIEYWRWPHSTDPSNEGEDAIVESFNEGPGAEMGIEVTQETTPFNNYMQNLTTAIGGGDAPAVGWGYPLQLYDHTGRSRSEIEENAPWVYLDDYIEDAYRDQFYERHWRWQEVRYNGVVGIPYIGGVTPGLFYINVDAWNEAGLGDLPTDGWSWDEFHDAARAMAESGAVANPVGIGLSDVVSNTEWQNQLPIARTHGNIIDYGFQNTQDEYVMSLAKDSMAGMWDDYYGTPIENGWSTNPLGFQFLDLQEQFVGGEIGMMHHSTFSRAGIAGNTDFEWALVPYPTEGGEDYWVHAMSGFSVLFHAYKEEVGGDPDPAWEFIKYRNNARNQYEWFNLSGQAVPNEQAYQLMEEEGVSDFVDESNAMYVMDAQAEAQQQSETLREARIDRFDIKQTEVAGRTVLQTDVPQSVGSGRVHEEVGNALQRLAQGDADTQEEFTSAEEGWAQLIDDNSEASVDPDSIGYNMPTPQPGPL